ncbi:hypothetical protein J0X19_19375 [Hymenobacter sp. BT186]|uniref:Uncharacterized protein n=1 Tax=Hymenobacter telluris TaxID=2816474 RepID=A0A939JCE9_9BACT|nr:hypothetical protein [Hymenobacter telluris]MBO0360131.1 hypothetical protein [Hymenobacter telluris]MBW3376158.1 hypothetical protein [Hymenobacter norwichensis]
MATSLSFAPTTATATGSAPASWPSRAAHALRVLYRVNPVLSWVGWLNVGLALVALALLPFDHRVVTGIPVWVKPLKFSFSVLAYAWTLGWLLADLPAASQRAVRWLSAGVALSMVAEQTCIFLQASRGTTSHFNGATAFDGLVFAVMGVFIMLNTALTLWAVYLVWRHRPHGPAGYVWGVRLGLLLFLVGSVLGGMMIHLNQHTVGAPDGGPGLPGIGWSTRAGDLRIAHFLGLHALQVVPLLGWWLSRQLPRRAVLLTWLGAATYAGLVAALFMQAMHGVPLLAGR